MEKRSKEQAAKVVDNSDGKYLSESEDPNLPEESGATALQSFYELGCAEDAGSAVVFDPDTNEAGLAEEPEAWQGAKPVGEVSMTADRDLARLNATLKEGLGTLLQAFEAKLAYDQSKQVQIDRLHDELQQHRGDLVARTVRPLINSIIRLHDDAGKLLGSLKDKPEDELTPKRFFRLFDGFQEDLEGLLGDNGVTAYREVGGPFDPRRQRLLRKIPTSNEALAGLVAESLRPGFEQGTQILEKERILAYEYRPVVTEEPPTSGAAETIETQNSDHTNEDDGRG